MNPLSPLECDSVSYVLSTSYSDIPAPASIPLYSNVSKIRYKFPGQNLTYELLKKNFMFLNVFYEETKYLAITEQESMSWIDCTSNIGGTMGRYLLLLVFFLIINRLIAHLSCFKVSFWASAFSVSSSSWSWYWSFSSWWVNLNERKRSSILHHRCPQLSASKIFDEKSNHFKNYSHTACIHYDEKTLLSFNKVFRFE